MIQSSTSKVILVAEDDLEVSQLIEDIVRDEGYQVIVITRGSEVVDAVARLHPTVLLLDLALPDLSGNEVLHRLATNPATNKVPVVVVSAFSESLLSSPLVRAVVNKPFEISTLLAAIQEASN